MTVDFHFQTASIVKYRTDVTFGWLELLVAFGGIAGLFLGCSILSGVEIAYYLLVMALMVGKRFSKRVQKFLVEKPNQVSDVHQNDKRIRKKSGNVRVIKIQSLSDIDNDFKKIMQTNKSRY